MKTVSVMQGRNADGTPKLLTREEMDDAQNWYIKWSKPTRLDLILENSAQFGHNMGLPIMLFDEFDVRENVETMGFVWSELASIRNPRQPDENTEDKKIRHRKINDDVQSWKEQLLRIATDNQTLANLTRADLSHLSGFDDDVITCLERGILLLRRQLELYKTFG